MGTSSVSVPLSRPSAEIQSVAAVRELRPAWLAVSVLMTLSGFAALGYQIVWTQQLGVWLGHEIASVLAVVTAFFGGLATGAHVLGTRIASSARPGRWYAALEAVIGGWALALAGLMPVAGAWLVTAIGAEPPLLWHWVVAFAGPFLLLLPATAAMGATLPAMERALARVRREGYAIGGLYAVNTLGAVAGVLLTAFVLAPRIGFMATACVCAAASLLCALIAFRVLPDRLALDQEMSEAAVEPRSKPRRALLALGATGLLGIGFEVTVVRVLSQITENTLYTFALLLAVYLLGTSAGGGMYQRWLAHLADAVRVRVWLLGSVAAACVAGAGALWSGASIEAAVVGWLGVGFEAALLAEAALAVAAFALPTVAMGALFSHLCVEAKASGWSFGSALAANTLGAALAAPLIGLWLLPASGAKVVALSLALGYLLLLPPVAWLRVRWALPVGTTAAAILGLLLWGPPLAFVTVPPGGKAISHRDGVMAAVSVVEDARGVRTLHINNREQEGSSATAFADGRQAWLPLTMHPAPRSALFLGLGTGVTAAAAASDARLSVDAVELLPEVIEAAAHFVPAFATATEASVPRIVNADARRYVRSSPQRYDVVIADLFHPARSGSAALYTVEHFAAVRERVADGGLFCQWLPLHQLDLGTLRSVVGSFLSIYPDAVAVLATHSLETPVIGLVARQGGGPVAQRASDRPEPRARRSHLQEALQLDDELAILGSILGGPRALTAFAAGAPLNTDDRPVVAHLASRLAYAPDSSPRERLLRLLGELHVAPDEILGTANGEADAARHRRLAAYWTARTRYLEAGIGVRPDSDVRRLLAQVQGPLLDVLRISPDFRPAYDPLLNMAVALARIDPGSARALLERLHDVQPARPEAADALRRLAATGTPAAAR